MKPLSLFGAGVASKSLAANAQRRLNCYVEVTTDGDKTKSVIYGTPGLALQTTLTSHVRGLRAIGNYLYCVNGPNLTALNIYYVPTVLAGTVNNLNSYVSLAANATQLMLVDGVSAYTVTLPLGAVTALGNAVFTANLNGAQTVTYCQGYLIVPKPSTNQFWVSNLNDATTWVATFFQSAYSSANTLVAVDADHGVVILFGTDYIEYWYPSGALDFPFAPIQNAVQQFGLAAIFSRAHVANSIVFLASDRDGQYLVMQIALTEGGYAPKRVSTSDIENIFNRIGDITTGVACSYRIDGHSFYQLTFPANALSLLLDLSTGIWSEVQTGVATTGRHVGDLTATFNAATFMTDNVNGNLYRIDPTVYTDNGTAIKRLLQSRHLGDGNNVTIDELFLDMETGVGLNAGQGSNPQLMLEVSKDGGRTYGNQRFLAFGKQGEYQAPRAVARRVANGRDLVLRVSLTDPVKFVVIREGALVT